MTEDPACCTPSTTIRECAQMMCSNDTGIIPVVQGTNDQRVIGVVTDRDIACRCVAAGMDPNSTLVSHAMSTEISCVMPDSSIQDVLKIMEGRQVRRVPVTNDNGSLIGIVSQADIALSQSDAETGDTVQKISQPYVA